jgi:hypothetical protein
MIDDNEKIKIYIKYKQSENNYKNFLLKMKPSQTVKELKQEINKEIYMGVEELILVCDSRMLIINDKPINYYSCENKTVEVTLKQNQIAPEKKPYNV